MDLRTLSWRDRTVRPRWRSSTGGATRGTDYVGGGETVRGPPMRLYERHTATQTGLSEPSYRTTRAKVSGWLCELFRNGFQPGIYNEATIGTGSMYTLLIITVASH